MNNELLLKKIDLVVNKLMNLGGSDEGHDKAISIEQALKHGDVSRDAGIEEWDWPQGVGLYGLLKLQAFYQDDRYMSFFQNWYASNMKKGLPSKNINTTTPFLTLVNLLEKMQNDQVDYEMLCKERANWLMNDLPKTKEGCFQHVTTAIGDKNGVMLNDSEMWIDTLFMAVLFLNKMGYQYDDNDWKEEAAYQVLQHIKYLFDKQSGLFYHGFSFNRNDNFGGIFWCRGNSWFTYGMIDYLETSKDLPKSTYRFIKNTFQSQVDALIRCQTPCGLWPTVLTDPSSYVEVSGSAAIAAGILKGIKAGILDSSYQTAADRAIQAICDNIEADGTVLNVSAGTGMGMDAEHYKNIMIRPMAYGQSLVLVALCEALR